MWDLAARRARRERAKARRDLAKARDEKARAADAREQLYAERRAIDAHHEALGLPPLWWPDDEHIPAEWELWGYRRDRLIH